MNQAENIYQPGDLVRLKSGGPLMTVVNADLSTLEWADTILVYCTWFDDGGLNATTFKQELLEAAECGEYDAALEAALAAPMPPREVALLRKHIKATIDIWPKESLQFAREALAHVWGERVYKADNCTTQ